VHLGLTLALLQTSIVCPDAYIDRSGSPALAWVLCPIAEQATLAPPCIPFNPTSHSPSTPSTRPSPSTHHYHTRTKSCSPYHTSRTDTAVSKHLRTLAWACHSSCRRWLGYVRSLQSRHTSSARFTTIPVTLETSSECIAVRPGRKLYDSLPSDSQ